MCLNPDASGCPAPLAVGTDITVGVMGNRLFAMVTSVAEVVPRFEFWVSQPAGQRNQSCTVTCPSLTTRMDGDFPTMAMMAVLVWRAAIVSCLAGTVSPRMRRE